MSDFPRQQLWFNENFFKSSNLKPVRARYKCHYTCRLIQARRSTSSASRPPLPHGSKSYNAHHIRERRRYLQNLYNTLIVRLFRILLLNMYLRARAIGNEERASSKFPSVTAEGRIINNHGSLQPANGVPETRFFDSIVHGRSLTHSFRRCPRPFSWYHSRYLYHFSPSNSPKSCFGRRAITRTHACDFAQQRKTKESIVRDLQISIVPSGISAQPVET